MSGGGGGGGGGGRRVFDGRVSSPDPWIRVDDDQPLPATGDVLASPLRAEAIRDDDSRRFGLRLEPDHDVAAIDESLLRRASLIELRYPTPTDGRASSQARRLRRRGYRRPLRAVGRLLPDYAAFLFRLGFDELLIDSDRFSDEEWLEALSLCPPSPSLRFGTA